jgi:hypothetical protein
MSSQTHYTEQLLRRISELRAEYEELEKLKESSHKELVTKLEAANKRILELESQAKQGK